MINVSNALNLPFDEKQRQAISQIKDAITKMYKNGISDDIKLYLYVTPELFKLIHSSEHILNCNGLHLFGCEIISTRLLPSDCWFVITQYDIRKTELKTNAKTVDFKKLTLFKRSDFK